MALIARLPKRSDQVYQEEHYGSKLQLRLHQDSRCFDGTYEPSLKIDDEVADPLPQQLGAGDRLQLPGHAVLFGDIVSSEHENLKIKGEWRHVRGPLGGGSFEMEFDSDGVAAGWWQSDASSQAPTPWRWSRQVTPESMKLLEQQEDDHVVQTVLSQRFRKSLSSRLGRTGTFFDELLDSEGGNSVRIARWGVLCAWIFLFQTLVSLFISSAQSSGTVISLISLGFQAVYTSTYMSFLVIYARMNVMPPKDYVAGVALYTFGYACFLALYAMSLLDADSEDASLKLQVLYVSGSLLFLTGSAALLKATNPPPIQMLFKNLSILQGLHLRYAVFDQQTSLFWGSTMFFLGSGCFTLDSAWGLLHAESQPEHLGLICAILGYSTFAVGRVYFLCGSTTKDCNVLFLSGPWQKSCLGNLMRLKACCPTKRAQIAAANSDSPHDMFNVMTAKSSGEFDDHDNF